MSEADPAGATPLQEWFLIHCLTVPDRKPFFWDARDEQVMFVRDVLANVLLGEVTVIGTHRSKSVELPVYCIANRRMSVFLRGNFHDWKMTVIASRPVLPPPGNESMFRGFDEEPFQYSLNSAYFDGFPPHLVLPPYSSSNRSEFSAAAKNDHALWAICKLLRDSRPG